MPTRSYYFPDDFRHLENIALSEMGELQSELLNSFRPKKIAPIYSESSLALFLGISTKIIHAIRIHTKKHYRFFRILKKSGDYRDISTPRTYLKVIQWWILDNILNCIDYPEFVFGFVKGRSAINNAQYHKGSFHLVNVDLKNFFPSIKYDAVENAFLQLGYSETVSKMLADLCCLNGELPQGAPTSPALANLCFTKFDIKFSEFARKNGLVYSRYADDLTFSAKTMIDASIVELLELTLKNSGFVLNEKKTRFRGQGDRMEVTGVVINDTLQPPRIWRKKVRAKIHKLVYADRLTRKDVNYLFSIKSLATQFPDSLSVSQLSISAKDLLDRKIGTVIGFGERPVLPNGLTLRQAEALAKLRPTVSNQILAIELGSTEVAVKSRLQEAYKKIDVSSRTDAYIWARANL
jgi:RNA-directed DNA polymerase